MSEMLLASTWWAMQSASELERGFPWWALEPSWSLWVTESERRKAQSCNKSTRRRLPNGVLFLHPMAVLSTQCGPNRCRDYRTSLHNSSKTGRALLYRTSETQASLWEEAPLVWETTMARWWEPELWAEKSASLSVIRLGCLSKATR